MLSLLLAMGALLGAAEARGWQVDTFAPRAVKHIRLTGLRNSTGQNLVQVIEFEACNDTGNN